MSRYQNRQQWCECQLVAIWNAVRFWGSTKGIPEMGSCIYRSRCALARAIYGGAIETEHEFKHFGLMRQKGRFNLRWVRSHLPSHFAVFCHQGYHSVLVIGIRGSKVLLANYAEGRTFWMEWKRLLELSNRRVPPTWYVPVEKENGG
jgi:hypothetical protein